MERYTYNGKFTLAEQLSTLKIPELRELIYGLGYKFRSGLKKDALVYGLNKIILENPQYLVDISFSYELQAYLDVIEGRLKYKEAEDTYLLAGLNRFHLIYALETPYDDAEPELHFVEDLAERIRPLIADELECRERDGRLMFEKLVIGCANIYGYTNLYYISRYEDQIRERLGDKFNLSYWEKAYSPIIAVTHTGQKGDRSRPFMSPFAGAVGFDLNDESINFSVKAKKYDLDTILKYGEMPYPTFPIKELAPLNKCLEKYGRKGVNARDVIRNLWLHKQSNYYSISVMSLSESIIFKNEKQINECYTAASDFLNNLPSWFRQGNTSAEVYAQEMEKHRYEDRMPHITLGPNLRSMGIESFEQLLDLEEWPAPKSDKKVGRNDLCPCGSGKKFKHCCGK